MHRPCTVLNVGGDRRARGAGSTILRRAGFDVIETRDGAEALGRVKEERPALVLLDLALPDLGGFEVCRRLRADPETCGMPVLCVSPVPLSSKDRIAGLDAGADGFLVTPFEPDELIATVRALLRGYDARAAMPETKERLEAALFASATGTFRWDIRTNALDWDDNLDRLFGLPPGQTARHVDEFLARVHPDDRAAVAAALDRCAREGVDFDLDFRVVWPDGGVRWLADKGRLFRDRAGRPLYMTGACTDITARKATELALRESEARLRLALKAGKMGFWEFDPATGVLTASETCKANFGRDAAADFSYEELLAAIHPEDRERMQAAVAHAVATGSDYDIEYRTVWPDGSIHWIYVRGQASRAPDGAPLRMTGVSLDSTERKRAELIRQESEARLRRSESLLSKVLEALPVGVWIMDADGRIARSNPAGPGIWGGARYVGPDRFGEYRGWWAANGRPIAPDEWAAARAIARGETSVDELIDIECFDGTRKTILNSAVPLRDEAGRIVGGIIVNQDVTARREAELALNRALAEKELLLKELDHRVKNLLSLVQSLAMRTGARSRTVEEFQAVFAERLRALAQAHGLLLGARWRGADLRTLVDQVLAPHRLANPRAVAVEGAPADVTPRQALTVSLVLHELATNAAKYGALCVPTGRVEVTWRVEDGVGERLALEWRERGGPAVEAPRERGFGTTLIERACAYELGGEAELRFEAEGVRCRLVFPLREPEEGRARVDGDGGGRSPRPGRPS